jgi:Txe/YoeB family toxin of Txe-Axe toxin-antitoxin module
LNRHPFKNSPESRLICNLRNGAPLKPDALCDMTKPAVRDCPRCNLVNTFENKYCSKCSYPLVADAFDEIKEAENSKLQSLEEKHRLEMNNLEEKMEQRFNQVISMIKQNPVLAHVKPEVLTKKNMQ